MIVLSNWRKLKKNYYLKTCFTIWHSITKIKALLTTTMYWWMRRMQPPKLLTFGWLPVQSDEWLVKNRHVQVSSREFVQSSTHSTKKRKSFWFENVLGFFEIYDEGKMRKLYRLFLSTKILAGVIRVWTHDPDFRYAFSNMTVPGVPG